MHHVTKFLHLIGSAGDCWIWDEFAQDIVEFDMNTNFYGVIKEGRKEGRSWFWAKQIL